MSAGLRLSVLFRAVLLTVATLAVPVTLWRLGGSPAATASPSLRRGAPMAPARHPAPRCHGRHPP